jgi:hypothetical protein
LADTGSQTTVSRHIRWHFVAKRVAIWLQNATRNAKRPSFGYKMLEDDPDDRRLVTKCQKKSKTFVVWLRNASGVTKRRSFGISGGKKLPNDGRPASRVQKMC